VRARWNRYGAILGVVGGDVDLVRCRGCGASEPLGPEARHAGWGRCKYCGTPNAAPMSGFDAYEGPESNAVLVHKPGRWDFVLPAGHALDRRMASFVLVMTWFWTLAFSAAISAENPRSGLAWLFAYGALLLGGLVTWRVLRAWFSVLHVQVNPFGIEVSRTLRGKPIGQVRHQSLHEHGLVVAVRKQSGRSVVELPVEGKVQIRCSGEREARWLATMLELAAAPHRDEHAERRCAECGAPFSLELDAEGSGAAACAHCGAGYVVDTVQVRPSPVRLPALPEAQEPIASDRVQLDQGGDWLRLSVYSLISPLRLIWGFAYLAPALLAFRVFLSLGALIRHANPPWQAELSLLLVCAVLLVFASACLFIASSVLAGRKEIWFERGSLRCLSRIGPPQVRSDRGSLTSKGPPRAPRTITWLQKIARESERAFRANLGLQTKRALPVSEAAVALLRLVEVKLSPGREPRQKTTLFLVTPAVTQYVEWVLPREEDRWLQVQLVAAIQQRLRALGRETATESH
jgi:hypothetical protein